MWAKNGDHVENSFAKFGYMLRKKQQPWILEKRHIVLDSAGTDPFL
jgi:hypothetical protein